MDVSFTNAEECEANEGMSWTEPAFDRDSCVKEEGCYEYYPELGIVGYQYPLIFLSSSQSLFHVFYLKMLPGLHSLPKTNKHATTTRLKLSGNRIFDRFFSIQF